MNITFIPNLFRPPNKDFKPVDPNDPFVTTEELEEFCGLYAKDGSGIPKYITDDPEEADIIDFTEEELEDIAKVQIEREKKERKAEQEENAKIQEKDEAEKKIKQNLDRKVDMIFKKHNHFVKKQCPVMIPYKSSLTHEEHKAYLRAFVKFQIRAAKTGAEAQEYEQYLRLQNRVYEEQKCFMNFSYQVSRVQLNDYNEVPEIITRYIDEYVQHRCQRVSRYKSTYVHEQEIPIRPQDPSNRFKNLYFKHTGHLLSIGTLPWFKLPNVHVANKLGMDEWVTINQPPTVDENPSGSNKLFKTPVSEDPNAVYLAQQHRANIVTSASALKVIADNYGPNFDKEWDIPVIVKTYHITDDDGNESSVRVVFIDKPMPKKIWTPLEKQQLFFKKSALSSFTEIIRLQYFKLRPPSVFSYERLDDNLDDFSLPEDKKQMSYDDDIFDLTSTADNDTFGIDLNMQKKEAVKHNKGKAKQSPKAAKMESCSSSVEQGKALKAMDLEESELTVDNSAVATKENTGSEDAPTDKENVEEKINTRNASKRKASFSFLLTDKAKLSPKAMKAESCNQRSVQIGSESEALDSEKSVLGIDVSVPTEKENVSTSEDVPSHEEKSAEEVMNASDTSNTKASFSTPKKGKANQSSKASKTETCKNSTEVEYSSEASDFEESELVIDESGITGKDSTVNEDSPTDEENVERRRNTRNTSKRKASLSSPNDSKAKESTKAVKTEICKDSKAVTLEESELIIADSTLTAKETVDSADACTVEGNIMERIHTRSASKRKMSHCTPQKVEDPVDLPDRRTRKSLKKLLDKEPISTKKPEDTASSDIGPDFVKKSEERTQESVSTSACEKTEKKECETTHARKQNLSPEEPKNSSAAQGGNNLLDNLLNMQDSMLKTTQSDHSPKKPEQAEKVPDRLQRPWSNSIPTKWDGHLNAKVCPEWSGTNVHYQLFSMGYQDVQPSSAAVQPIKVIVRHNIHGLTRYKSSKAKSGAYVVYPKLENQPYFGCEVNTLSEITEQWVQLLLRPNTTLLEVRVCRSSGEILKTEEKTLTTVLKEGKQTHISFAPHHPLSTMYSVFTAVSGLSSGEYLLHHDPNNRAFIKLMKGVSKDVVGHQSVFNLHKSYSSASAYTRKFAQPPWLAIDTHILTPFHRLHFKIPGTFPMENPKKKLTKSMKKKIKENAKKKRRLEDFRKEKSEAEELDAF